MMKTVCKIQTIFSQEIDPEAGGSDLEGDGVHRDPHRDVSLYPPGAHHLGDCTDSQHSLGDDRGALLACLGGHGHRGVSPHPHHLLLTLFLHLLHTLWIKTQGKENEKFFSF